MGVEGWTCPECDRLFGRNRQSHDCSPAMSLEEYFSTGPSHERPIFDAVMRHLKGVGPLHVEPVSVGIFLKNPRNFAELRPKDRWVAVSFGLNRKVTHPAIKRKVVEWSGRYWHVANVTSPADVESGVGDFLIEAYRLTRPASSAP